MPLHCLSLNVCFSRDDLCVKSVAQMPSCFCCNQTRIRDNAVRLATNVTPISLLLQACLSSCSLGNSSRAQMKHGQSKRICPPYFCHLTGCLMILLDWALLGQGGFASLLPTGTHHWPCIRLRQSVHCWRSRGFWPHFGSCDSLHRCLNDPGRAYSRVCP